MDGEPRTYLTVIEQRVTAGILRPIERKLDDVLDKLAQRREELHAIRGHLVNQLGDALLMRGRITKIEHEIRQLKSGK